MKRYKRTGSSQDTTPGYQCKARIWIEKDGETFIGFGRIILLERIAEYGSISRAAKSMAMSYKHAWDLVDSMNRKAGMPVVTTSTGGKGGGGALLTETGKKIIHDYHELRKRLDLFLTQETANLLL